MSQVMSVMSLDTTRSLIPYPFFTDGTSFFVFVPARFGRRLPFMSLLCLFHLWTIQSPLLSLSIRMRSLLGFTFKSCRASLVGWLHSSSPHPFSFSATRPLTARHQERPCACHRPQQRQARMPNMTTTTKKRKNYRQSSILCNKTTRMCESKFTPIHTAIASFPLAGTSCTTLLLQTAICPYCVDQRQYNTSTKFTNCIYA